MDAELLAVLAAAVVVIFAGVLAWARLDGQAKDRRGLTKRRHYG